MWSILLGLVTTVAPKLISSISELWEKYGEKWLIYRKGATDQHRKDQVNQLERESDETKRAQRRVEEIQKDATDKRGTPADGSDIFGELRKPGESGDWLKPKSNDPDSKLPR